MTRHMLVVGLAVWLSACAQNKAKAPKGLVPDQSAKIEALEAELKEARSQINALHDADHWSNQTIKDLQRDCDQGHMDDGSYRYPVTTAPTPRGAIEAVNRIYVDNGIEPHDPNHMDNGGLVKHVKMEFGKHYPDVVCFDFVDNGEKTGQTCFDPMEITER